MNVLRRQPTGRYSFRHALLGEAVYDDLLPGERVRLHAQYVAALQSRRGPRHRRRAGPARPAGDGPRHRAVRQHPGRRRGQPVGGPGRGGVPLPAGARAARRPAALRRTVDLDLVQARRQRRRGAQRRAATRSAPVALVQEQLDRLPADTPPAWRARMLTARAGDHDRDRHRRGPGRGLRRGARAGPRGRERAAGPGAHHPRPGARRRWVATTRRRSSAWTRSRSPSGSTSTSSRPRRSPRSAASRRPGPRRACARPWSTRSPGPRSPTRVHAELRGRFLLGRSFEDWAEFDESERGSAARSTAAVAAGRAVRAVRLRVPGPAHLDQDGPGRLGRGARAHRPAPRVAAADPAGASSTRCG